MRKAACLLLVLLAFYSCASKSEVPERIMEDGVEVVLNRLEPYAVKGEPSSFTLEREFAIDTENDTIAGLGLTDMGLYFDVDSVGNIYIAGYENTEGMIFKFDGEGGFYSDFNGIENMAKVNGNYVVGVDGKGRLYFIENDPFPRIIRCALEIKVFF